MHRNILLKRNLPWTYRTGSLLLKRYKRGDQDSEYLKHCRGYTRLSQLKASTQTACAELLGSIDHFIFSLTMTSTQEIPEQLNGCDCGVFTCKYAEYLSQDKTFDFDQGDMPYFRRRMIWEMVNKTLL